MNADIKPRYSRLFCSLLLAGGMVVASGQAAAASEGDALGVCKQKVAETFGDKASVKLNRIKTRKTYTVEVKVSGVSEKPFKATCEVDRDGKLQSFAHEGPAK